MSYSEPTLALVAVGLGAPDAPVVLGAGIEVAMLPREVGSTGIPVDGVGVEVFVGGRIIRWKVNGSEGF